MRADEYLEVLRAHAPELRVDAVVADPRRVEDVGGARRAERGPGGTPPAAAGQPGRRHRRGTTRCGSRRPTRDVLDGFLGDVGTRENPPE